MLGFLFYVVRNFEEFETHHFSLMMFGILLRSRVLVMDVDYSISGRLSEARRAYAARDFNSSAIICSEIIEHYPRNIEALFTLAHCFQAQGLHRKSLELLQQCLYQKKQGGIYLCMGSSYAALSMYAEAIKALENASAYRSCAPEAYLRIGNVYRGQKDFQKAIHYYRQCLSLNPSNASALHNLGITLNELDPNNLSCLEPLRKAVELRPGESLFRFSYGLCLSRCNLNVEAKAALETAIYLDNQHIDAYFALAREHHLEGNITYVHATFSRFKASNKESAYDLITLGKIAQFGKTVFDEYTRRSIDSEIP